MTRVIYLKLGNSLDHQLSSEHDLHFEWNSNPLAFENLALSTSSEEEWNLRLEDDLKPKPLKAWLNTVSRLCSVSLSH